MLDYSSLLIIPEESVNPNDIFGIAITYAHSAKLIQNYSKEQETHEYLFPAVTCASFALELLAKFFVFKTLKDNKNPNNLKGHNINKLWKKISPELQNTIIGMYKNTSGVPYLDAIQRRREIFESAFQDLIVKGSSGNAQPYVDWRYPYELTEVNFVSLTPIMDILEAFGQAAQYIVNIENKNKQNE